MNFEEFSKQAREKLDQHSSGIDAEGLWESIAPVLEEDKRKRRFFILPFFAAFLGITAFFALWYWGDTHPSGANVALDLSSPTPIEWSPDVVPKNEKEIAEVPLSNRQAKNQAARPNPLTTTVEKGLLAISTKPEDKDDSEMVEEKNIAPLSNPRVQNLTVLNREEEGKNVYQKVSLLPAINAKPIAALPTEKTPLLIKYRGLEKQKSHRFKKGFGISGGVGLNAQRLTTSPAFGDYQVRRQDTESTLEDIYLGLDFMIQPTANLGIRTGLHATRIGSKFSKESTIMEFIPVENSLQATYISAANQDTTQIFGTVFDEQTTTRKKLTYNYSYLLDVPLIITYSRQSYPWVIGVEAGALWNLHLQRKGNIYDEAETYYDLAEDPNAWFKDRVGVSVYLGTHIAYHLSRRWQVSLSPAYRFPVELSTGNNPISQKYSGGGVYAGLRYWW